MTASRAALPHRIVRLLVVLALLVTGVVAGLIADVVLSTSARAAGSPIQIAVHPGNSPRFTGGATTPLLDTRALSALAPGGSVSGVMAVRNDSGDTGTLSLAVVNLTDCPGAASDGCAAAGAALADALRFDVAVSTSPFAAGGASTQSTGRSTAGLQTGLTLATNLPAGAVRWVRVTAALPPGVGDAAQFGAIGFDLQLGLAGVAGQSTHVVGPHAGSHAHGTAGLAATGVRFGLLGGLAGLLVAIGAVLVLAGRRRSGDV